uniref:Ubiquitin-like protease family profile domain-containing protein n=1 Tax=Oryza barthii TaxID=65489 RepID=A0A0D3F557_9ORYZ
MPNIDVPSNLIRFMFGQTYEYLPQDYELTDEDVMAIFLIEDSTENCTLVDMGDFYNKKHHLTCLLSGDKFLNDDVISVYIHCIREQANNDKKVKYENPFLSDMLKAAGVNGVNEDKDNFITKIVKNYLDHELTYEYLPQDYELTDEDVMAIFLIEDSTENCTLVDMGDFYNKKHHLTCLLSGDKFLNDDVISVYIHCIREQANNDKKVKYENPFLSDMLKAAGVNGVNEDKDNFITKIVKNYLDHELIFIPINMKDKHWYLAVVNTEKQQIQVLDSMCMTFNRVDLANTLQGLQYHLNIIGRQQDLPSHKWGDLNVIKWPIIEQLKERIQEDRKIWVQSSMPHFISLSLKQLQTILKKDEPLESECLNMAIHKFMYEKIEMIHETKEAISNHCLYLQFWILIPVRHARSFIVLVVDQESQTLYVLDPNPLMPEYKNNPNMRYTRKLITICDHFNKAMRKACPGTRWNEDINLWRQVIVNNPVYNRMVTS